MDRKGELNELNGTETAVVLEPSPESSRQPLQTNSTSVSEKSILKNATSSTDIDTLTVSMDSRNETPSPSLVPAASTNQLHFSFVTHMVSR